MIRSFLTTAFRNLLRNKLFSLINITGLAIGISASLIIFLIVRYEFSFEKYQPEKERIYRIAGEFSFGGNVGYNGGSPIPMGVAAGKELTHVDVAAFFLTRIGQRISIPAPGREQPVVHKKNNRVVYADKNYFRLIPYEWVAGSPESALEHPFQTVLTESKAAELFAGIPLTEIPGREIIFSDTIRTTVSGIVKDILHPTDFTFNVMVARSTYEINGMTPEDWTAWDNVSSETQVFLKINEKTTAQNIEAQINALYKKNRVADSNDKSSTRFILQPLNDLHFNADYDNFDQRLAHKPTLYGLIAIAVFLLLLGCINFINLTTAQSSQRAKEIGIRKTLGSSRKQLIAQFISETFLLTLLATLLSVLLTPLLLKAFSDFIPDGLHYKILDAQILLFLLLLTGGIALLAGIYPALVLSSYRPVAVLKNITVHGEGQKGRLRRVLSVSQFVIAQFFIIVTLLVSKQIRYSLNKDLGFKKDAIIFFNANDSRVSKVAKNVLVEKLRLIPGIEMISRSFGPPSYRGGWTTTATLDGQTDDKYGSVSVKLGDPDYIKLYKIPLLAGSNLPPSDTLNSILINETYLHQLGYQDAHEIVGKTLKWNGEWRTPIVGVVADFHERSMHDPIKPVVIGHWKANEGVINIALAPQDPEKRSWQNTIAKIERAWKETYPDDEAKVEFLDQTIAKYYESEQHISSLLVWASGLTLFISCLGLLGLIIYTTNQRTKEIGIRKVIGASVSQIITLLSKEFLWLILIAFLIAVPAAWYGGHRWLENFSYRTSMPWWIFLAGGLVMVAMAFLTLISRTFRVATANPVHSLRSE